MVMLAKVSETMGERWSMTGTVPVARSNSWSIPETVPVARSVRWSIPVSMSVARNEKCRILGTELADWSDRRGVPGTM